MRDTHALDDVPRPQQRHGGGRGFEHPVDDIGLTGRADRQIGARAGRFFDVGVDDRRRAELRAARAKQSPNQLVHRLFFAGRERRRPHNDQLPPVSRADPRPGSGVGLPGVDLDRRLPVPTGIARDKHVGHAVHALEVHQSPGPVFGHRDAAKADDVLAGAGDRSRLQDLRAGLLEMGGEDNRGEAYNERSRMPPARPQAWGRHGFDAHQDGQDNCQNTPRSRSEARLHRMVTCWSQAHVSCTGSSGTQTHHSHAIAAARAVSPRGCADPGASSRRRSRGFLPRADPGSFVSRPIPLRGLIGRETKGPGLLPWLGHSREASQARPRMPAHGIESTHDVAQGAPRTPRRAAARSSERGRPVQGATLADGSARRVGCPGRSHAPTSVQMQGEASRGRIYDPIMSVM